MALISSFIFATQRAPEEKVKLLTSTRGDSTLHYARLPSHGTDTLTRTTWTRELTLASSSSSTHHTPNSMLCAEWTEDLRGNSGVCRASVSQLHHWSSSAVRCWCVADMFKEFTQAFNWHFHYCLKERGFTDLQGNLPTELTKHPGIVNKRQYTWGLRKTQ